MFYVWFDAPIAYIAAAQGWAAADPGRRNWRSWWWQADEVEYLQFLGKDNVPFHAIGFPCTLLGSGEPWKTVDVIKGVNWLTYEGGKFSTSEGRGVFLDRALDLAPADAWRWWLAANAPEGGDTDFGFGRFAAEVNHDLADSFGNLVNRVLSFTAARFGGVVPEGGDAGEPEHRLAAALDRHLADLRGHHRDLALRRAAAEVRAIWRLANAYLAEQAPWTAIRSDPGRAAAVLRTGIDLVRVAAVTAWAFIPDAAGRVLQALGPAEAVPVWPDSGAAGLRGAVPGQRVLAPPILFAKFPPGWAEAQRQAFAGVAGKQADSVP
ncbi:class I tRNA ligase family protein [Mycobacterium sp. KBS0706]|uniref:class I tRNA ligase family protein n=1 Tax=Mycobacterium sp. KBS0706 TaxID=2578109 RepID=UPI001C8F8D6B|nr:class I tRNA ligase family protein [Mycobacterium sp. KBS0706]